MTARVRLVLQGPLDQLRLVWQTGELLLQMVPFRQDPEGQRHSILLAVQEMLTNVLRHAHQGDEDLPIQVDFAVDGHGIEIALEDRGRPFDPCAASLPSLEVDGMPEEPGGFGILIARMVMDRVEYRRNGDRNLLVLFKASDIESRHASRTESGA